MSRTIAVASMLLFLVPCFATAQSSCGVLIGPALLDARGTNGFGSPSPTTFIDVGRPAVMATSATQGSIDYTFLNTNPVTVKFASVYVSGNSYVVRNSSVGYQMTGQLHATELHQFPLSPSVVFQPGDLLAVILSSSDPNNSGGIAGFADNPNGIVVAAGDVTAGPVQSTFADPGVAFAANVTGIGSCNEFPAPEVFFPAVGDVTGLAHYTTDVRILTLLSGAITQPGTDVRMQWTLRDRTQGAVAVSQGSAVASKVTRTGATLGAISGIAPPYLGTLTVAFPDYYSLYDARRPPAAILGRVAANARIAANTASGESASTVPAVSCNQIGHQVAVAFHVPANHRLNVGIASAQLNSCGIFKPATLVHVNVNGGTDVPIPMPGESIQLNDVTGSNSVLPDAKGLTDGVIYVTVDDEASRIVAYTSVLDNGSQSSNITLGLVTR